MYLIIKSKSFLHQVLNFWGSAWIKRILWNMEFAKGRWDYADETPGDCVYRYVEKYAQNGNILDIGCGSGNTGNELDDSSYQSYTGVDVSDVAIQKAVSRSELSGRVLKNHYIQSDMLTYRPQGTYRVILFRESLYYVPLTNIIGMLQRYQEYLDKRGVFVVRLHDRHKYKAICELIRTNFHVLEEFLPEDRSSIVIVFGRRCPQWVWSYWLDWSSSILYLLMDQSDLAFLINSIG